MLVGAASDCTSPADDGKKTRKQNAHKVVGFVIVFGWLAHTHEKE